VGESPGRAGVVSELSGGRGATVVLAVSAAALVGSMFVAVRRDGAVRELITVTDSLRQEVQSAREALNGATRRADSLASRRRILEVAGRMGLRPAEDEEIRILPEATGDTTEFFTERSER